MIRSLFLAAGLLATCATAQAAEKPVLNIYTYDSFVSDWGPGPAIEEAFEATCDCDLKFTAAGDGAALLSRLKLEGARTKADIVLGFDTSLLEDARATGLFAPHGAKLANSNLPIDWADADFLPYDWGYFAFVYDNTKLKRVPKSFRDLAAAPDDLKIVIQDPRSSTPGLGLLLWIKAAYGDEAPAIWEALAPHIVTVTKGWSEAYGMFLEGEADLVLSYTTSPAYHILAEEDASKSAAVFSEGHYMQIEVAGKVAGSEQQDLADKFLAFMVSPGFQDIIPTTNWMYPAVKPAEALPAAFDPSIGEAPALLIPSADVPALKAKALEEWLSALSK